MYDTGLQDPDQHKTNDHEYQPMQSDSLGKCRLNFVIDVELRPSFVYSRPCQAPPPIERLAT
jgi:hypothetical protein